MRTTRTKKLIPLTVLSLLLLLSPVVHAQSSLVPQCNGPCTACDFFRMGQNILNFIWLYITAPAATIMLVYGGFLMMMPGDIGGGKDSSPRYTKGKKVITRVIMAVLAIFFSWIIIDTILKVLAGQKVDSSTPARLFPGSGNLGPWNRIECAAPPVTVAPPPSPPPVPTPPTVCSIPPLSQITDPLAQQMEQGQKVIWGNTNPLLRCSANRLIQLSGRGQITSAYRPPPYQTHLWEIKDRWCAQGLRSNTNSACSSLKNTVAAEVKRHWPSGNWNCGEVGQNSRHSSGTGIDIDGVDKSKASSACLMFRNYEGDPWHFDLNTSCNACP